MKAARRDSAGGLMLNIRGEWRWLPLGVCCALALIFADHWRVRAQGGIRAEEVIKRAEAPVSSLNSAGRGNRGARRPKRPSIYQPDKAVAQAQPARDMEYSQVGVTVWRLQEGS